LKPLYLVRHNTDKHHGNGYAFTKGMAKIAPAKVDLLKTWVGQHPVSVSCVAHMLGIKQKTSHHWYKGGTGWLSRQSIKAGTWGRIKLPSARSRWICILG